MHWRRMWKLMVSDSTDSSETKKWSAELRYVHQPTFSSRPSSLWNMSSSSAVQLFQQARVACEGSGTTHHEAARKSISRHGSFSSQQPVACSVIRTARTVRRRRKRMVR